MADALNIGTLVGALELDDNTQGAFRNFNQNIVSSAARVAGLGDSLSSLGQQMQTTGRFIGSVGDRLTFLAIPLALATKEVINLTKTFERDMVRMVTTAGLGEEAMHRFREQILQLGPAVGKGPEELATALYSITSVGMRGAEAMDILDRSARASAVGLGQTKDVSQAVVAAMTAYGKENISAAQATDMLLAAVREGGAEADDFAHTLGRVVGTAAQVGIGFDELLASVSTFTRVGVRADEAVTALRGTIAFLMKPSAEARAMLEGLGTSIQEVRDKVKKDGLADALIELVRLTAGNEDALGKIIPNVRALAGVLANTGQQATAYKDILQQVQNSHGDLDKAFARTSETAAFKFDQLMAKLKVMAIEIGGPLVDTLTSITAAAEPLLNMLSMVAAGFSELPGPVQTATIALLGVTLLSGPFMSFGGRLIEVVGAIIGPKGLGGLIRFLSSYTTAAQAATVATDAYAASMTILDGVILGTTVNTAGQAAATGALVLKQQQGLQLYIQALQVYKGEIAATAAQTSLQLATMGEVVEGVVVKASRFSGVLRGLGLAGLILAIGAAVYEVATNFETYSKPFEFWINLQIEAVQAVGDLVKALMDMLGVTDLVKAVWDQLNNVWGGVGNILTDIVTILENTVVFAFYTTINAIKDTVEIIKSSFLKVWDDVIEKIAKFAGLTEGELAASLQTMALRTVIAIQPLRDMLVVLGLLNDAIPSLSRSTKEWAETTERLVNSAKLGAAARGGTGLPLSTSFGKESAGPVADPWSALMGGGKDFSLAGLVSGLDRVTLGAQNAKDPMARLREESSKLAKEALAPLSTEMQKVIRDFDAGGKSAGQIAEKTGINEAAVRRLLDADKELVKASEKRRDLMSEINAAYIPLNEQQKESARSMLEAGISASKVADYLKVSQVAVKNYKDELDDAAKLTEQNQKRIAHDIQEYFKDVERAAEATNKQMIEASNEQRKALDQWTVETNISKMTGLEKSLAMIERERQAEKDKYIYIGTLTDQLEAKIDEYYDHQVKMATGSADTIILRMNEVGVFTKRQLQEMADRAKSDWEQVSTAVDEATGELLFSSEEIYQAWLRYQDAVRAVTGEVEKLKRKVDELRDVSSALGDLGQAIGGDIGKTISGVGKLVDAWAQALLMKQKYAEQPSGGATGAQKVGSVIGAAAGVLGATGAGSTQSRAIGGALAGAAGGAAIGAAFAPATLGLSVAVGAVAGFTVGLIRGGMALTEYQKRVRAAAAELVNLRRETLQNYGSFENLSNIADLVGINIQGVWNTKDPEFFKSVMDDIIKRTEHLNEVVEKYGITWADMGEKARGMRIAEAAQALLDDYEALLRIGVETTRATDAMSDSINNFLNQALKAGSGIPPGLQPIIEQLITMGKLTDENARLMLGMTQETLPSLAQVEAAAKRYGLELTDLGPKIALLTVDQLVEDFNTFMAIGADANTIIKAMGEDIQNVVTQSMKAGFEIPASMKPLIQAMIDAGTLTDDTGEKMTDLSRLNFAKPLSDMVDELIKKLDELIQKFIDVGNVNVKPQISPQYVPTDGEPGQHPETDDDSIPMARGGDFIVNRPTKFLAGEAGIERVSFSGAGFHQRDEGPVVINWYADGKLITRVTAPHLAKEMKLLGVKPA